VSGQYAIVVDRRSTMPELEVHAELSSGDLIAQRDEVQRSLEAVLERRLHLRVKAVVADPGGLPRQEIGKAKRVFERTEETDELLQLTAV
jgi:phenylacetate-coenzyme A ligase PaaK-like adenylate-forming protein